MLSPHKKYRIKRNKEVLAYIVSKLENGFGVRETLRMVGGNKSLKVSETTARDIYYRKEYKWSPYFEYNDDGEKLYEVDCYGEKVPGTETNAYWKTDSRNKMKPKSA